MSLIINDVSSLDCERYISDVFYVNTGIWWHYDHDKITQISGFTELLYTREIHKKDDKTDFMSGSNKVPLLVYIITINLI